MTASFGRFTQQERVGGLLRMEPFFTSQLFREGQLPKLCRQLHSNFVVTCFSADLFVCKIEVSSRHALP